MKILIAIDSFKGCLRSTEANQAAAEGVVAACPEAIVKQVTVSDGGEGFLEAFHDAVGGEWVEVEVSDPLRRPVRARYLLQDELAVIEMAEASGLTLLKKEERNPLIATSLGTGQLVMDAARRGAKRIIVGLGGSATSDAGRGMLEALDLRALKQVRFTIASDVNNPLCGPNGAAAVFGPQKGATPQMVAELDERARRFAEESAARMGYDRSTKPGAGAAGGLGYAFMQYLDADCRSGIDLLLETIGFDALAADADLVITGEGAADRQTLMGKLPMGILRHSGDTPVALLAGHIADRDELLRAGFTRVECINRWRGDAPSEHELQQALQPSVAKERIRRTVKKMLPKERWRMHPFLGLMLTSLLLALLVGLPLPLIPKVIGEGFSATFTSIGVVIILGALIGLILEKTGAALTLADGVIRLVGEKRPALALELMGWVVSIPVFCDSGFVILNPIRKALAKRTGVSSVTLTVCLACGLYISHVFIPPTPGPIAAAQSLGIGDNLLLIMALGIAASVFPLVTGYLFARFIGGRVQSVGEDDGLLSETYEALKASYGRLPGLTASLAPLLVPIVLMAAGSVVTMLHADGRMADLCLFLGNPMMAIAVGAVLAVVLLAQSGKGRQLFSLTDSTLRTVGPILFITAAGSVLGRVIAVSGLMEWVTVHAPVLQTLGLFFPFLIAAVLKTAQGSSTVAITTTAGLVAPLLPALGLTTPTQVALAVLAIGAGAMTVSHANDSYFWVVTRFGNLSVRDGYRTQTLLTLLMGLSAILGIFLLNWLLRSSSIYFAFGTFGFLF